MQLGANTFCQRAFYALAFSGQQTAFLSAAVALTIVVGFQFWLWLWFWALCSLGPIPLPLLNWLPLEAITRIITCQATV